MTTDPYDYTDPDGDALHVSGTGEWLRMDIEDSGNSAAAVMTAVLIAVADVRKVTAAMHEKAGLPDRWKTLRERVDADIDLYDEASFECGRTDDSAGATEARDKAAAARFIRVYMDDLEAGQ
jgi:hypothetical protein